MRAGARAIVLLVPLALGLAVALRMVHVHDLASFAWFMAHVIVAGLTTLVLLLALLGVVLRSNGTASEAA